MVIKTTGETKNAQEEWHPSVNPWLAASAVMLSTFMVVLDSSVANVALPHIAGTLSASNDESTWVLTSYIVANAIMIPASGWIARRIGRKRLLLLATSIFTIASLFCGISVSMPMLVMARVLQGIGGGCMQPLAQAIMLESFPPHKQGTAMAFFGMGIVVAPVIGPTLGGWITDSFSWRWIFYINLPVGLLALFLINLFVEDPSYLRKHFRGAIDLLGFTLMALWLGSLQLVLDKGQEADWFGARWICWTSLFSIVALAAFIVREFTCAEPIVQLRVLKNRNFAIGTLIASLFGFALYGITALVPLFLQTLLGYSALDSGLAASPRGVGSFVAMLVVGIMVNYIDARWLLAFGFVGFGWSALMLSHVNLEISMWTVAFPMILNGFSGGFTFVPMTTLSMGALRKEEIGNASGIYNLMRNIGGSVGIAVVTASLVRGGQIHQNYLSAHLAPGSAQASALVAGLQAKFAAGGASLADAQRLAMGNLYRLLQQQASLLAYMDDFRLIGYMGIFCVPLVALMARAHHLRRGK